MKYATRHDANHTPITDAYRKAGVWFRSVSRALGLGCDLLARHVEGYVVLIEVKDGEKPPSARKLTPAEESLQRAFPMFYKVVCTPEDALQAVGLLG